MLNMDFINGITKTSSSSEVAGCYQLKDIYKLDIMTDKGITFGTIISYKETGLLKLKNTCRTSLNLYMKKYSVQYKSIRHVYVIFFIFFCIPDREFGTCT